MTHADFEALWQELQARLATIGRTPQGRRRVAQVEHSLKALPAGAQVQFWLNPRGSLNGMSPIEALEQGNIRAVLALAQAFVES